MALGLSEASLIAIFVESVLFGGLTILFVVALYTLYQRRKGPNNSIILWVSVLMYNVALAHIIVDLQRAIEGFTSFATRDGGSDAFFNDVKATSYIVKEALYEAQTILGDGFMIYRLYIVWLRDRRILIPGAIWMAGGTFLAFYGVISLSKLTTVTPIFIARIKHIDLSFYAITLGVNVICTGLIAYRVWSVTRQTTGAYRSRDLSPVPSIIIESGAIYSAALIALITTFALNSWAHYPVFDSMPQLIGIVFMLVIVRIALGLSPTQSNSSDVTSQYLSHRPSRPAPISVQMTSFNASHRHVEDSTDRTTEEGPKLNGMLEGGFKNGGYDS